VDIDEEAWLAHYGILRRSGRYPWGSGKTQEERNRSFLGTIKELKDQGLSETEIARGFGISTSELRAARSIANNSEKQANINMARRLKDKGYSNVAIGRRMGLNESSVRALLAPGEKDKADVLEMTSSMLKDEVDRKHYIDIGSGVERHLGLSSTKLSTAVARLKEEGYTVHYIPVEQLGTGKKTTVKVLAAPGTSYSEAYRNRDNIQQIMRYSEDGGRSFDRIMPPLSIDSKRVAVRYAEDGGADADGVIYVRPGVKDVTLGGARYAQVRVAVDGTHYLKGMAMYKDDLPAGTDLMFNTNKSRTGNKLDAMKPMKDDPDSPFGAVIKRQIGERGPDGKKRLTSVMNLVNEEGDWEKWSRTLSSQMLSKQSPKLAKTQLALAADRKQREFDEIMHLENPAVKKKLLEAFADDADSSAVHLKAAALPKQGSHVILPVNTMKETEVYAPNFHNGDRVVLVRYPHGGIFEIPELTVNNNHPDAKRLIGTDAKDAIGIHSKVAARLSGADFDGDTVLVIPNNNRAVKTAPALEKLKGFDPQHEYPGYEGMTRMTPKAKQVEMGLVSNLITDMTIRGATADELARAVRHSMVVIDAEKHGLDWRRSAIDHGIPQLKEKYQGRKNAGASTLISRAGAEVRVPERKLRRASEGGPIDKTTGEKVYVPTGTKYINRYGKEETPTVKSTQLAETNDAHTLSSGTPIEKIYADHSNTLKGLANKARLAAYNIKATPYSKAANERYASQVKSLDAKLNLALRNSPLERQSQIIANAIVRQKLKANPDLEPSDVKKLKAQALTEARIRTGAKKTGIEITDDEWAAIQAGAISNNKLTQILNNADLDAVKQLATPKTRKKLDSGSIERAIAMLRNGYPQADVADQLGVSVSTLKRSLAEGDA
jgi:DNA-binding CsgD family transcriptional regulator